MTSRRGWWRGWVLLALTAALVVRCDAPDPRSAGDGPGAGARLEARVTAVVDGDTVRVELAGGGDDNVRYIGIDTPESNPDQPLECFGREAAEENRRLVGGRTVELEVGAEPRDRYGRLLAYVRLPASGGEGPGRLVNAALVRGGFARTLTIAPNDELAPLLRGLEATAARAGRGLWGACGK